MLRKFHLQILRITIFPVMSNWVRRIVCILTIQVNSTPINSTSIYPSGEFRVEEFLSVFSSQNRISKLFEFEL